MRAVEPWRQMVPLLASWNVMELRRLREMYVIFCECASGRSARANLEVRKLMEPGKIPAEEEILAGRGGSPGRPGGRPWAAGGEAAGRPGGRLGGSVESSWGAGISPPGGLRGGDHASCAKWPKTEPKSSFSRGSRPGPPAGIPAPPEHLTWLRRGRFRVLLRATLLPDGCPVGVRRQVWTAQGGLKPP
jgi:hypothetical protein